MPIKLKNISIPIINSIPVEELRVKNISIGTPIYCILIKDESLAPIAGAAISLIDTGELFFSDSNGVVLIGIKSGTFNVFKSGYFSQENVAFDFSIIPNQCFGVELIKRIGFLQATENQNNYILWSVAAYSVPVGDGEFCQTIPSEKQPFAVPFQGFPKYTYKPSMVVGEKFSFYANFNTPIIDPTKDNWKIGLVKIQINDPITKDFDFVFETTDLIPLDFDLSGSEFRFYANEFTVPTLKGGIYRLLIYDDVLGEAKFISNEIFVRTSLKRSLSELRYRNSYDMYDFNYEGLTFFENVVHVDLVKNGFEYAEEKEGGRAISSGKRYNTQIITDKIYNIKGLDFDVAAHDATIAMRSHDGVKLNNCPLLADGNWDTDVSEKTPLSNGEGGFFDADFSRVNRGC